MGFCCTFCANFLFADSSVSMPSMPSISSPSMPSLTAPTISWDNATTTTTEAGTVTTTSSTTSTSGTSTGSGLTAAALMGLSNTTGVDTLSALIGGDSASLSDDDTSSLSTLSSLLSGITVTNSNTSTLSALTGSSTSNNTSVNLLLTQIITKLNELSAKIDALNASNLNETTQVTQNLTDTTKLTSVTNNTTNSSTNITQSSSKTTTNNTKTNLLENSQKTKILRFRINGYDILDTITNVYISEPEKDGSFFLTGDRTYIADYKQRTETFYMLFSADSNVNRTSVNTANSLTNTANTTSGQAKNILGNYTVAISVMQDYENPNSFVYQLAQKSPVTAVKTGNLASIIFTNGTFKTDLLISLN